MTGIGYNRKEAGDVKSIEQLFDPKYKGKVTLLAEARDTLGIIMLDAGQEARPRRRSTTSSPAIEYIDEQNRKGQIRKFTGNDYTTDLAKGNIVDGRGLVGRHDPAQGRQPGPRLRHPRGGRDALVGQHDDPAASRRTAYGAEVFMNYVYDPEVAAKIAAYVNYVTPVKGVAGDPRQDRTRSSPRTR